MLDLYLGRDYIVSQTLRMTVMLTDHLVFYSQVIMTDCEMYKFMSSTFYIS